MNRQVATDHGPLTVISQPTPELSALLALWPLGFSAGDDGRVVHLGSSTEMAAALKLQQVEVDRSVANYVLTEDADYLLARMAKMAQEGVDGVLLGALYARDKGRAGVETGVALFDGATQSRGREPRDVLARVLDPEGLPGRFLRAPSSVGTTTRFDRPFPRFIDIQPTFAADLGAVIPIALVAGRTMFLLGDDVPDDDPGLAGVVAAGLSEVVHHPVTAGWRADDV